MKNPSVPAGCHRRFCRAGEILFLEGDLCREIGQVASGRVLIRSTNPEGRESVLQAVEPGAFFGDVMLLAGEDRYLGNVVAETDAVVDFFPLPAFLDHLASSREGLAAYLRELAIKTFSLKQEMKLLAQPTLGEKILFFLGSESARTGSDRIRIGLTRDAWASRLGVARPSLSRELSRLTREGKIRMEGKDILFLRRV